MKKKGLVFLTALIVIAMVSACAPAPAEPAAPAEAAPAEAAPAEAAPAEAAPAEAEKPAGEVALLISAAGTLDDRAFNQGCLEWRQEIRR